MGEFFKGWRRKAGLVTLAMACVLAVVWVRSVVTLDKITVPLVPFCHYVHSGAGVFVWLKEDHSAFAGDADYGTLVTLDWRSEDATKLSVVDENSFADADSCWFLKGGGFVIGVASWDEEDEMPGKQWLISYSLLVLPLTLLSAWLILGQRPKPRATNSGPSQI